MKNKSQTNRDLLLLLKEGDMAAFDAIFNKYCNRVYGFVIRYVKREEDADDIVQEVFIKIWESRMKIDVYLSFDSFLYTIAYNTTISLLRKRVTEKNAHEYLKSIQQIKTTNNVIDELHFKQLKGELKSLTNNLTPRQKEIFILSREEGLSYKEIAHKLNISTNTVKNHLVTALKYIKSHMNNRLETSVLFIFLFL